MHRYAHRPLSAFHAFLGLMLAGTLGAASADAQSSRANTVENWRLNLNFAGNAPDGVPDNTTQIGTDPQSQNAYDDLDIPNAPPAPAPYVDGFFLHPTSEPGWDVFGFGREYAIDIQSPLRSGETREWQSFKLRTNQGSDQAPALIQMTWPDIQTVPSNIALQLLDPDDLNGDSVRQYDMRGIGSFSFTVRANGSTITHNLGVIASLGTGTPNVRGDINGDGTVNVQDATLALRAAVGLITLTETQRIAGDVNGDNFVGVQDATTILRLAVGLP